MSYPDFLLDKRVIIRNIGKGIVDKKELDKVLKALPDREANSERCSPPEPRDSGDSED